MRKADLDNFNNVWQDAITHIVYDDDSQISELHLYTDRIDTATVRVAPRARR
jgi:Holliday junction resolvase RusA-like endonuclease